MRPIFLDEQNKEELIKTFTTHLNKIKLSTNTINFTAQVQQKTENNTKATLIISPKAYLKMMLYVRDTPTEIAWHGTVIKQNTNTYIITDVFLYPQKLSAATVTTVQEKYNNWCVDLADEQYDHMRLQGHSHVNFSVSPSGTDLNFYDTILQVLNKSDFYIFMIMNKNGDMYFLIYDLENNTIYEKQDINLMLKSAGSEEDIFNTVDAEKAVFCEKPVTPVWNQSPTAVSPYTNPYHRQYPSSWGTTSGFYEDESETDKIFEELDNKFKNAKLEASKSKKGKKK